MTALEVEVLGREHAPQAPDDEAVARLVRTTLARRGIGDGHLAVTFVTASEIAALNERHRGRSGPTDVLSFPIDEDPDVVVGPRELGDVVICAEHTVDIAEAIVHGTLHLTGMDHEADDGEMLALQDGLMEELC